MSEIETDNRLKYLIAGGIGVVAVGAGIWYLRYRSSQPQSKSSADLKQKNKSDAKQSAGAKSSEPRDEKKELLKQSQDAKNKGNKYYKGGKYEQAIECYTQAIKTCPAEFKTDIATFYQNRAAAHEQLKNYDEVLEDCNKALENNGRYTKALSRRAKMCENNGNFKQSLEDITAVCILESFRNQASLAMADRVLQSLGRAHAKEAYQKRKPINPSSQFIRSYFSAFANDPIMNSVKSWEGGDSASDGSEPEKDRDETPEKEQQEKITVEAAPETASPDQAKVKVMKSSYEEALENLARKEYTQLVKLCSTEINTSTSTRHPEALLLRATFYLLRGEGNKALEDFDKLLGLSGVDKRIRSNALIKRGSLRMQNGDKEGALADFVTATGEDPENSDIFHHRGQLNLLIDQIQDAMKDFEKSVELSPSFPVAAVQKCYTEYRVAFQTQSPMMLQSAMKQFNETLTKFPECAEGFALYGQAMADQQMFDKAEESFQTASKLEPDNANYYVHRALLRLQWKQDIDAACTLIRKGLQVDDKCEFAYETLGTIDVQRGNLNSAMELFQKAIALTRTEMDMAHLFSLFDAATAQRTVTEKLGITLPNFGPGGMPMM